MIKNINNELYDTVTESLAPLTENIISNVSFGVSMLNNDIISVDTLSFHNAMYISPIEPIERLNIIVYNERYDDLIMVSNNTKSHIIVDYDKMLMCKRINISIDDNVIVINNAMSIHVDYVKYKYKDNTISEHNLLIAITSTE